jgi:hypothetical protein
MMLRWDLGLKVGDARFRQDRRSIMPASLSRVLPKDYLNSFLRAFPLDWRPRRGYRLPQSGLGPYYIEWDAGNGAYGERWTNATRDSAGVLLTGDARAYHPIRIAQFGLHSHARWCFSRGEADRHAYLAQARWLAENARDRRGVQGCLVFDFPWPKYGAQAGWISAMAQGEAISLLLRAAEAEGDDAYAEAALNIASPFRFSVEEGGVVFRSRYGDTFLEEVAVQPACHILNGHIFSLWGLLDLASVRRQPWIEQLASEALRTLRSRLNLYDAGYWSYYSLLGSRSGFRNVALLKYHAFHVAQLRVTAALTGDQYFADTARRWQEYADSAACRRRVLANTAAGLVPGLLKRDHMGSGAVDMLERLGALG